MLGDVISASTCENWRSHLTCAVHASLSKHWSLSWLLLFLLVAKHYLCSHLELYMSITVLFLKGFVPFLLFTMSTWNAKCSCKSILWRANAVFQPYNSEIFVPDHHSIFFGCVCCLFGFEFFVWLGFFCFQRTGLHICVNGWLDLLIFILFRNMCLQFWNFQS